MKRKATTPKKKTTPKNTNSGASTNNTQRKISIKSINKIKAQTRLELIISKLSKLKMNGKVWILEQLRELQVELEGI